MANLKPGIYDIDLAWRGGVRKTFQSYVDPNNAKDLRQILLDAMKSFNGDKEHALSRYELRLRNRGNRAVLMNFRAAK